MVIHYCFSNDISEEDQLGYLALCPSLRSLTLEGNPLSITLAGETVRSSDWLEQVHTLFL